MTRRRWQVMIGLIMVVLLVSACATTGVSGSALTGAPRDTRGRPGTAEATGARLRMCTDSRSILSGRSGWSSSESFSEKISKRSGGTRSLDMSRSPTPH